MSRIIEQIATVQFQVQTRQASATMQALQEAAKDLAKDMDSVNEKIAALGKDVPKDNPQLLNYQNMLRSIKKDYDDVMKAQRDFMRGAKAADQLWKAAQEQNIESLSFRSIKSGISGLRKRQEGLSAGDAKDMQDWRIIQNVIQEADRIVKEATADVQNTIQVIRDGGKVSEQAMRQTINALRDLRSSVDETDADFYKWGGDLDFMEGKLKDFTDAQRRARGEMVDANDARREALKLTKEGAEAAKKERDAADEKIASLKKEGEELIKKRELIKQNIEATRKEIDEQHKLIEKKHSELAAAEGARKIVFDADRAHIEGLQTQAQKERALATEKSDAAEKQMRYTELLEQQTDKLGQKVVSLQEKLAKINAGPQAPKPNPVLEGVKQGAEEAEQEISRLERIIERYQEDLVFQKNRAVDHDPEATFNADKMLREQKELINVYNESIEKQQESLRLRKQQLIEEGKGAKLKKEEMAFFKAEESVLSFFDKTKAKATELQSQFKEIDLSALAKSDSPYELLKNLTSISEQIATMGDKVKSSPVAQWIEQSRVETERLKEEYRAAWRANEDLKKHSARYSSEMDEPLIKIHETLDKRTSAETQVKLIEDIKKEEQELLNYQQQLAQAQQQSTAATEQQTQATETQEELEGQLAKAKKEHKASQEQLNKEREKSAKLQGEAIEQDNKAAAAEGRVADATSNATDAQAKYNIKMEEGLQDVKNMENAQTDMQIKLDGQEQQLKENSEAYSKNAQDTAKAEADKRQAQELTIQQMEEMKALLEQENRETVPANTEKWHENEAEIERLDQKIREYKGEWMSLEEAQTFASKAGKDGFIATAQQLQQAQQAMERYRESLIKTIQQKQRDGEITDKEEQELAELEQQMKDLKFEQDNFNMSHKKMQNLLSEPTKATDLDELKAAIKRADGELHRMQNSLGENSKEYQAFAEQVKNAKNVLKEMEGQAKATASAWDKAWSRLKTYVGMYMGFNIVWSKFTATGGDLMDLSDKMGEVRKTTGFTADEVGKLSDNLAKLDTRTNLTGLMEFSSLAGSIGMKTQEQVQGFTEAANMLAVSLPEMGNEASRTLMKIADATGDLEKNGGNVRETLERVGSTIIALRANSAAAAGPITDFVSRVGAVGAQAGISIDQIAALGATVDALGGRVEMSATALSRMIPAIRNNTFEVAKAIGMTEKELKGKTAMEQMIAIFKSLRDSAKGFDTSTEEGMNAMADSVEKALGRSTSMQDVMKELNQQGARAGIVFGLLSQNVDKLEEQLETAGEAYSKNTALMEEYNKMNDTTAAKWAKLKNQFEEFFVGDSTQRLLGWIIDGLRKIIDLLTDESGFGWFFRFTLINIALIKSKWSEAIGSMIISVAKYIASLNASTAATTANTTAKTANAAATTALGNATAEAAVKTGIFAKAWGGLTKVLSATNIITAVVTALTMVGLSLLDTATKSKEAAKFLNTVADAEKKAKEESVKQRAELEKLYKATQDQNKSLEERKQALHDMVGDEKYKKYYENLSTESELAAAAAKAYKELADEIMATARARAFESKAEELQGRIIELEDEKKEAEERKKEAQQRVTRGQLATSLVGAQAQQRLGTKGMSQMATGMSRESKEVTQARSDVAKENQAIADLDKEIESTNKDIERLKKQVETIKPQVADGGGSGGDGGGGGGGNTNPYGDYNKVTSPYSQWNGDDLVARRKEMLERVKALANGADVQKVLSEDAKFITDAVRKNIKTTEQAIEWYNTERLKIQEALHEKHLTNTGDWMDPKKGGRKASKMVQDEMKYYLDELDAYYTERKAKIQEARNDEQITEAEAWRRTLQNDAEWQQRRGELMELYTKKSEKVTKEEKERILDILSERTGDSANYILKDIANTVKFIEKVGVEKGKPAMDRIWGDIDLGIEQAFLRQRNAVGKQMDAIAEIINKERPFNGITKNLQDNLTKMGILQADFEKQRLALEAKGEDTKELDKKYEEDIPKRLSFILGEAENAWTTSVEEIMKRMADAGMTAWADEIRKSPKMQEALIAQLHNTYDQIQEAIKKEASLMKKQAENMWNNILLPGGDGKTTVKDAFEKAIAQLGLDQGRVSRANSLINAGPASERVADKLAIKQMQLQLTMQTHYFNLMKKQGLQRVQDLERQADLLEKQGKLEEASRVRQDKTHAEMSLRLATTKEQTTLLKQQEEIIAKTEESQARLYKELKEWTDLLASSMQSLFEASNAGNAEYYNERARIALEGEAKDDDGKVKVERYVIIEDAGTSDAEAHYEELTELQKIEREREIEQQNAQAEAWKKVMDDINMKMSETITDHINAMLQDAAVDANTDATKRNTEAIEGLTEKLGQNTEQAAKSGIVAAGAQGQPSVVVVDSGSEKDNNKNKGKVEVEEPTVVGVDNGQGFPAAQGGTAEGGTIPVAPWPMTEEQKEQSKGYMQELWNAYVEQGVVAEQSMGEQVAEIPNAVLPPWQITEEGLEVATERMAQLWQVYAEQGIAAMQQMSDAMDQLPNKIPDVTGLTQDNVDAALQNATTLYEGQAQIQMDASNKATDTVVSNEKKQGKVTSDTNTQNLRSTNTTMAKMTLATQLYGLAYQTMSNDNLNATQKFLMFSVQAAGQAAIAMLTTDMATQEGKSKVELPGILGKAASQLGPIAGPIAFSAMMALLGGLMGMAVSAVSKSKSQIAQATGASTSSNAKSISAGKLMTGMLTYGEGNVNEFTDPSSLTPGRSYNVDSADGKTYRARYMGTDPKTHLTNGPEFHLVGERGREAIIDAHTTRLMQMDDTGIWQAIQTLYNGGSLRHSVMRRKGRGMAAFADGNIDEFETMADGGGLMAGGAGLSSEQMMALQASIDRQSDLLERAMTDGIHAYFDVYGRGGLIDSYDTGKKTVTSHGERY